MYKRIGILAFCTLLLYPVVTSVQAKEGVEPNGITVNSYNPTEPEELVNGVKKLDIDESGTVEMDKHNVQGSINKEGLVVIDVVPRVSLKKYSPKINGNVYYVLDKGGDIYTLALKTKGYIEDKQGNSIQLRKVRMLEGRNGVADDDGFKSNLVPQTFLPKTGYKPPQEVSKWLIGKLLVKASIKQVVKK